ncbi:TetR/AcrR family transcriptional repressor of the ameABC operon [Rhizobium paknamense]|uniref:TetR/AcrR family transcriptional repressor of the ameABC operon n=2 Tax=Rhizobium paknamense TaxID=1206817 RepID=A0ABU0IIT6_9HYPH|nr:TetR/AcrR family transcriptional repressor of the ameABC operon [Rhizobium paknamense]
MADIATELNMSPANVFKHFHAKSALVDAIACAHIEDMMADLKGIDPAASPERKILDAAERLLAVLLRDVSANPHIFEMVVLCVDPSRTAGDFYREKISAVLQVFIDEGVRKGQFHVRDSGHTASVLATALGGILNPLVVCHEEPDILYTRCRDLVDLVILALQNPLAK